MKAEGRQVKGLATMKHSEEVGRALFLSDMQHFLEIKFNFRINTLRYQENEIYLEMRDTILFKDLIDVTTQQLGLRRMTHADYLFTNKEDLIKPHLLRVRTRGFPYVQIIGFQLGRTWPLFMLLEINKAFTIL